MAKVITKKKIRKNNTANPVTPAYQLNSISKYEEIHSFYHDIEWTSIAYRNLLKISRVRQLPGINERSIIV